MSNIAPMTSLYAAGNDLALYMARIYAWMTGGLLVTGIVAWISAHTPTIQDFLYVRADGLSVSMTAAGWIIMFLPLALVMAISFRFDRLSPAAMHMLYWAYAALSGLSLSIIFMAYTGSAIGIAFMLTAGMFGCLSLFGWLTKQDLSGMASFLLGSLIGLVIVSAVNLVMHSVAFQFFVSCAAVVLFAALTAYDTQKLKDIYLEDDGEKGAIMGALTLYLDVINIFLNILFLIRKRK